MGNRTSRVQEKLIIEIPRRLDIFSAIEFCSELTKSPKANKIVFDCRYMDFVEPFPMLITANAIRRFKKRRFESSFFTRGRETNSYASHMQFFAQAGLASSWDEERRGNKRYLAITHIDCDDLRERAIDDFVHPCDLLEEDAERMATVLAQADEGPVFDLLKYTTLEMMRNVIEHSESSSFLYCGQYWPKLDKVEIGFLDSGIGLKNSLEKNPKIFHVDEVEALNLAMTPGISATCYGPGGGKGKWTNAGYGLYMTSRLCTEGGSFSILSGSFGLIKRPTNTDLIETNIKGTGVRLILKPSNVESLSENFEKYKIDANKIAKASGNSPIGMSPSTILKRTKTQKNK